jgi:hypothetical protein
MLIYLTLATPPSRLNPIGHGHEHREPPPRNPYLGLDLVRASTRVPPIAMRNKRLAYPSRVVELDDVDFKLATCDLNSSISISSFFGYSLLEFNEKAKTIFISSLMISAALKVYSKPLLFCLYEIVLFFAIFDFIFV